MSQDPQSQSSTPRSSVKRLTSTDSSSGSWTLEAAEQQCGEDIIDSVFQWFAVRHIHRGNPATIYEEYARVKPITLQPLGELNANGSLASGLLRRRQTKA